MVDSELFSELRKSARDLKAARKREAEIWTKSKSLMRDAHKGGMTFSEIADIFGFTKARVYQLTTNKRGGRKDVSAYQPDAEVEVEAEAS